VIAIDGSPMQANASRSSNRSVPYLEAIIADGQAELTDLIASGQPAAPHADRPCRLRRQRHTDLTRLSRLGDRIARARIAIDKLHQRAIPSDGEIRVKVEAAQPTVARAQQRLGA